MDAAVAPWRIVLFGGLRAEQGGTPVITRFRSQKIATLLAYLARVGALLIEREVG